MAIYVKEKSLRSTIASVTSDFVFKFELDRVDKFNYQHEDTRLNTKAFASLMQPSGWLAQACECVNAYKFEYKFALINLIINTIAHD